MQRQRSKSRGRLHGPVHSDGPAYFGGGPKGSNNKILSKIISFVNGTKTGCVSMDILCNNFKDLSMADIQSVVHSHPGNFDVLRGCNGSEVPGEKLISVKTDLRLCETHCRRYFNCQGSCEKLHICRTSLLLGDMCCPFDKSGKICNFGHNFGTFHNASLLMEHNLSDLSKNELCTLFRRRNCRSVSTMPQICVYYNGKNRKTCSNKRCKSLHLCLDFVMDRCNGMCWKNHSMANDHVAYVLDLYAIDKSWPDQHILEDLRKIMTKRIRSDVSDTSSLYDLETPEERYDSDGVDLSSETELKGAPTGFFVPKLPEERSESTCCSHCILMRADMNRITLSVEALKAEVQELKISNLSESFSNTPTLSESTPTFHDHNCPEKRSPMQNQMLGQMLFSNIKGKHPTSAESVTRILLNFTNSYLLTLIQSPESFYKEVDKAVASLKCS